MQRPGITRERLVGLCMLGALLFSPALISLFDRGGNTTFFGVPVLLVYLFGVWGGLILVAAILIIRRYYEMSNPIDLGEED
ncbi:hypothetical protein GCM10011332_19050 [Terasakiella brassicae]|uniref:DUF3311 domain-containing protein n=1 Tax=Terasakiella brassicae TaxID=1634917 RepID=A0A917C2Q2_9PROT|nr:hypothetical protein [Terasakiella brassicae]GGF65138.1 hypothetical protein GCM10011332_19050 [Terasakiella brassicae]